MINWLLGLGLAFFFRFVFSLRYRVEIRGMKTLRSLKKNKGVLFLANHTAYSEAILLFSYLFPRFNVRSVPNEYMFRNILLAPMIKATRAVRMPRRSSNKLILKKAAEALDQITDGLKNGDRFIYYPGGQTKSTAKEWIGGSAGAYTLLQKVPDVQVVLVRTTGLWGSSFSRAFTLGSSPNLGASLIMTLKMLVKNLIFLSPRRNVVIELEPSPLDFPRMSTRMALNRYLENWYNYYPQGANRVEEEPLQLVSRSLWRRDLPELPSAKKEEPFREVSLETKTILYDQLRIILESPDLVIEPSSHLSKDLGMDSLHLADLTSFVSKRFEIRGLLRDDFQTVQDLLEIAERVRKVHSLKTGSHHWPDEPHRPVPLIPNGSTFHEIFLRVVDRMGPFAAIGDDLVGILTYKKLKKTVFVVAQALREIPEERVAILLPASAPALILFLACHFAGKIPVTLNWTLGEHFLEEMIRAAKVKTIISSWSFIDRLSHLNLIVTHKSHMWTPTTCLEIAYNPPKSFAIQVLRPICAL
jgi:long-chain-fatty-acid--[acyl-carrier-protein] ligase